MGLWGDLTGGIMDDPFSFQGSQDIVDPMGLMHDTKATREGKAYEQMMGERAMSMQEDWMQYIKDQYAPYSEVAEKALGAQMGLTGLSGGDERERMLAEVEADPFYQAKLRAGEEAVMRGASATGGLRSGGTSAALASQNQLMLGRELEDRYQKLAGLSGQGFSGQTSGSQYGQSALSGLTGTMGTLASGSAAARAAEADKQSGLMGLAGGIISAFSDERLKTNVEQIGVKKGLPWYKWTWNDLAGKKFGLRGDAVGFMASDVELYKPECVTEKDGYLMVNYGGIA
jgi:hypothetical protein